jgi:TolA-binding protein
MAGMVDGDRRVSGDGLMRRVRGVVLAAVATAAMSGGVSGTASAQSNVEARVGRLESEMRAVQRKVFPGGGQYLQPEITAPTTPSSQPGTPAGSAVADLSARVASVESQLATFTGQLEQAQFRQRQLQEQFDAYRRATDARLKAMEAGPAPIAPAAESAPLGSTTQRPAAPRPSASQPAPTRDVEEPSAPAGSTASVSRPSTGDAAEDAYIYGYRLWEAKRYTEAQTELKKMVAAHPKSRRASYAQNLLGRAYLDDGKPSLASMAFYENYKKMPDGERAPDSLLYLGQALVKLNKPADACKVYGELQDVYGARLSSSLQAQLAQGRTAAKCK